MSSPRPWGCFYPCSILLHDDRVFPTPVGVFPSPCRTWPTSRCLPHARGGVSSGVRRNWPAPSSSPRPWGCSHPGDPGQGSDRVFPTHVGVFPARRRTAAARSRLPHARGGVSVKMSVGIAPPSLRRERWNKNSSGKKEIFFFPKHKNTTSYLLGKLR